MNEKIDIRKALRVFQKITDTGKRDGDRFTLSGLAAFTDYDGYTATICNDHARLDIFFHNKFSFTFDNKKEKLLFIEKIDSLDKN